MATIAPYGSWASPIGVELVSSAGVALDELAVDGEQHGFRRAESIRRALESELYFYSRIFGFEPADPIEPVPIHHLGAP